MLNIGCHLSIANGFYKAALQALELGCNSFQFFTRNPRGGKAKALDVEDLKILKTLMENHDFSNIFAHGSYTMNLCSDKEATRTYALEIFKDDLRRINEIHKAIYVFHPGSHVKQGIETGIDYIVKALNESIPEDQKNWICLEGMSGKGTEIGGSFEALSAIINRVKNNHRLGVCLDTCHLYSAGYDIVKDLDGVINKFDEIVGLEKLRAFHLNDSKVAFASNKDRHEKIGEGTIGLETIVKIINHPKLKHLTFNLETPNDIDSHKMEIELLKSKSK
jgi:deoxyribonuclease-4